MSFAKALKQDKVAATLHETLEEEKQFDKKLTELAGDINEKAVTVFVIPVPEFRDRVATSLRLGLPVKITFKIVFFK